MSEHTKWCLANVNPSLCGCGGAHRRAIARAQARRAFYFRYGNQAEGSPEAAQVAASDPGRPKEPPK